jgi:NAD(P)-dependent dehydrogenase (short-subunit alcohol dehydrogenase family)
MSSEETVMPSEQKVAIVTGASQGIGAGAVQAYRKLGYAVVANSRHISSSADPGVLGVPGDCRGPRDRHASGRSGDQTFRPGGHAG